MQIIKAIVEPNGDVRLLEPLQISESRSAVLTILDEPPVKTNRNLAQLEAGYMELAKDEEAEREAHEWAEAMIGDVNDEAR